MGEVGVEMGLGWGRLGVGVGFDGGVRRLVLGEFFEI